MSIILTIGDHWTITREPMNYVLKRWAPPKTKGMGPEDADRARQPVPLASMSANAARHRWPAFGYYRTPVSALQALWREDAGAISAGSIEALAEAYTKAGDAIAATVREG